MAIETLVYSHFQAEADLHCAYFGIFRVQAQIPDWFLLRESCDSIF